jgi:hypothetical protein
MQILLLTTLTTVAFAANSVLCRMTLGAGAIDPASFTTVRLPKSVRTAPAAATCSDRLPAITFGDERSVHYTWSPC